VHGGDGGGAVTGTTSPLRDAALPSSPVPRDPAQGSSVGFIDKPFSPTPDPKYFYRGGSHGTALELLQNAIPRRDGVIVVTGDPGIGKTILCRALVDQLDRRTFTTLVMEPALSDEDLLRGLLQDFGVLSSDEMSRGRLAGVTKQELIETLHDFLQSLVPLGAGALLIVDEAQNLPIQTLEQIRILANLDAGKGKLLQVVLAGEPDIANLLKSAPLRELDERVTSRIHLEPFTADQTAAYVAHRLTIAGGEPPVQFEAPALAAVHRVTGGVPRLINLVCDRALLGASDQHTSLVTSQLVDAAAGSLDLDPAVEPPRATNRRPLLMIAGGLILLAVLAGAYMALQDRTDAQPPAAATPESRVAETPAPIATTPAPAAPVPPPVATVPAAPSQNQPAATAVPGASFSVLVASFRQPDEATTLSTQLRELGLPVRGVRVVSGASGVWHQVLVGPYGDAAAAARGQARVRQIPGYADARIIPR
jgi:general secretion pathway protein A